MENRSMVRWGRLQSFTPDGQTLARIRILAPLSEAVRDSLVSTARGVIYPRGEEIDWEPDERGELLFGVTAGSVSISFQSLAGKQILVCAIGAGGTFELRVGGWAGVDATVATALVQTTAVCSMPYPVVEEAVVGCPAAAKVFIEQERQLVRELGGLTSGRLHGPAGRVAHTLWRDRRPAPDNSMTSA
jgi:hypothetical protein